MTCKLHCRIALAGFHRRVVEEAYCVADTLGVRDALGRAGQMEHQMARGTRFTATAELRHSWSFMSKPRPHRKFSVE